MLLFESIIDSNDIFNSSVSTSDSGKLLLSASYLEDYEESFATPTSVPKTSQLLTEVCVLTSNRKEPHSFFQRLLSMGHK